MYNRAALLCRLTLYSPTLQFTCWGYDPTWPQILCLAVEGLLLRWRFEAWAFTDHWSLEGDAGAPSRGRDTLEVRVGERPSTLHIR